MTFKTLLLIASLAQINLQSVYCYEAYDSNAQPIHFLPGQPESGFFNAPQPRPYPNPQGYSYGRNFEDLQAQNPAPNLRCGTQVQRCPRTKYRSYDGSCNNLRFPQVGTPQSTYGRLLPPRYGDGLSMPTLARSGNPLPLSRLVSLVLFPDITIEDPKFTLNNMQYGQIITHDMSLVGGASQAQPHATLCCTATGQMIPPADLATKFGCFPIVLPQNDPQTIHSNATCMTFVRTLTDRDRNCQANPNQPAEQLTDVNHFLDLSITYGISDTMNRQLREFARGRLLVAARNGKEWMPQAPDPRTTCPGAQSNQEPCYVAGDIRVNQNPQLTSLQTIFFREHNRLANALETINPHWSDEQIFQEARRINIAQHQHITYYEWLPITLGVKNSLQNKIVYNTKGFVNDYDVNMNPAVANEHATAAFRFFHGQIAGHLDLVTEHRDRASSLRLSDWFNRPSVLEEGDRFDGLLRGLNTQPEEKTNQFCTSEVTQHLFRPAGAAFGTDLRAADIQRGRDHGLASYNDFRERCGLQRAHSFGDFLDVMPADNVRKLESLYETPDDVDLVVGGSLEKLVSGTLAGPVYLCILTEQFFRTRTGDRFFYENENPETGFTIAQLNEIRKTSISRLFCDNGDKIESMQPHGFERVSHDNIVTPCERLPAPDLNAWRENSGGFGTPKSFFNEYFHY